MAYRVYGDFEDTSDDAIQELDRDQFEVVLPHDIGSSSPPDGDRV